MKVEKLLRELAQREVVLSADLAKVRAQRALLAELAGDVAAEPEVLDDTTPHDTTPRLDQLGRRPGRPPGKKKAAAPLLASAGVECEATGKGVHRGAIVVHPCKAACGWSTARCQAHSGKRVAGVLGGHMRICDKAHKHAGGASLFAKDDVGGVVPPRPAADDDFDAEADRRAEQRELADADLWWRTAGIGAGRGRGAAARVSDPRWSTPVRVPATSARYADVLLQAARRGRRGGPVRDAGLPAGDDQAPVGGPPSRGGPVRRRDVLHAGGRRLT